MEAVHTVLETVSSVWQVISGDCRVAGLAFALLILAINLLSRGWQHWPERALRSCMTNLTLMLSNNYVFGQLAILLMIWAQATYDHFGVPHLDTNVWSAVPRWLMILIALLAMDFADYWTHRLLHLKWFWPIHAIHHSDTYVTVLTTARVHFLEAFGMRLMYIVLLGWLGFPAEVLGGGAVLLLIHNMYTHINIDWGHGPFKYLLASPRFHRWHHANTPEAFNKNLANVFPFYDVLFGTYYVPGPCQAETGADGVPTDDVVSLITWPVTEWMRLIGELVRWPQASLPDCETPRIALTSMESPATSITLKAAPDRAVVAVAKRPSDCGSR